MDKSSAERWVVISALIVAGIYGYRRLTEPAQPGGLRNLIGLGNPVPFAKFITAWGFVYFMLALATEAAPGLGGSMAILIAVSDFLTNAPAFLSDVTKQEGAKPVTLSSSSANSSQARIGALDLNLQQGQPLPPSVSRLSTTAPAGLK